MTLKLANSQARKLFLHRQGLGIDPVRKLSRNDWYDLIHQMGFVQVDSVRTLARAHDAILFSRNQTYRPTILKTLIEKDRLLFENWTHDASIIPMSFYPFWQLRFEKERSRLAGQWKKWGREEFQSKLRETLETVREQGPIRARDLKSDTGKPKTGWWDWHPGKTALEYHWRTGALAVCARDGFQKVYDCTDRVVPKDHLKNDMDREAMVDWCCRAALERLGVALPGEIAAFFDHIRPAEAAIWAEAQDDLIDVEVETVDGQTRKALAFRSLAEDDKIDEDVPARLRLLSPFDPILRDRKRALRLFGFDYRIEIFVPEQKRRYGYYVFPILQGTAFVGRIDAAFHKDSGNVRVKGLWLEEKVRLGRLRLQALEAELERYRRFCGASKVEFLDGWLKQKR